MTNGLSMWTIFDHPGDFPDWVVVRRFVLSAAAVTPTTDIALAESIEQARGFLPPGLVRFVAAAGDDPTVVETWV